MDTSVSSQAPLRPPEDIAAEGMWRMACGESCPDCWEMLPEDQKEWWRRCATQAVREWLAGHYPR